MSDEDYVPMAVKCPRCKTKQKVDVAVSAASALVNEHTILCFRCNNSFNVKLPDKIIRGPFPV